MGSRGKQSNEAKKSELQKGQLTAAPIQTEILVLSVPSGSPLPLQEKARYKDLRKPFLL